MTLTDNKSSIQEWHTTAKEWQTTLALYEHELRFIGKLLKSHVFEPQTPNLFERIDHFKQQLIPIEKDLNKLQEEVVQHDNELGGSIECNNGGSDDYFMNRQVELVKKVNQFSLQFNEIKYEVYQYCGDILKSHKK